MTLDDIRLLVVSVDPEAAHYESPRQGQEAYTVWQETRRLDLSADDSHADEGWAFTVDRFSRKEIDPIRRALFAALDGDERVAVTELTAYEPDTGYIHSIFDCQGV